MTTDEVRQLLEEGLASFRQQAEEAAVVRLKAMGAAEACLQLLAKMKDPVPPVAEHNPPAAGGTSL